MFHIEDVLQLKDSESAKLLVRRHPITLLPGLFVAMVFIVVPFFFLFPLFAWGAFGIGVFSFSILLGLIFVFRSFALWDSSVLIISSLRLIGVKQKGFFSRFVTEVMIAEIQDVAWKRQGIQDAILKTGTLSVRTGGEGKGLEINRISYPQRVSELIGDLRFANAGKKDHLPPELCERLDALLSKLEKFSPEALAKIERLVNEEAQNEVSSLSLQKKEIS